MIVEEGNAGPEVIRTKSSLYLGGEAIALGTALGRSGSKVSIIDNDFAHGIFRLSESEYRVDEHIHRALIKVERIKGDVGEVSVDYEVFESVSDDVMQAISTGELADFKAVKGTLTFAPGEKSKVIEVPILDDTDSEPDEQFSVRLANASGGAVLGGPFSINLAKIVIIDNDYASGKLEVANNTYSITESDVQSVITVRRVGGSVGEVSVNYTVIDGTAKGELDYIPISGKLAWADGDTEDKTILIPLINDEHVEPLEQFSLELSEVSGVPGKLPIIGEEKTIIQIMDDDQFGSFSFSSPDLFVNENSGQFVVNVVRKFGSSEEVTVNYEVTAGSARAGADFVPTQGTLVFKPGQLNAKFTIIVNDDDLPERPETINLILSDASPIKDGGGRATLGTPNMATLTVLDNETLNEPAGSIDSGFNLVAGADDFVNAIVQQEDGLFIIGGEFTLINGLKRNRIARLNSDGTVDNSFDAGFGLNDSVQSVVVQPDGRIVVTGMFTQVDGVNRNRIVRLNSDGSIDDTFNPGGGANNPIRSVALQDDGKLIIVGDFTEYNGVVRNGVARIDSSGNLDHTLSTRVEVRIWRFRM